MGVPCGARVVRFADFIALGNVVELPDMDDLVQRADIRLEIADQMVMHARVLRCKAAFLIVLPVFSWFTWIQCVIADFENHRETFR